MDTFSRPATLDDLKLLLRALNDHGAEYMLIGGYALAAHGYLRATTDIARRSGRHFIPRRGAGGGWHVG